MDDFDINSDVTEATEVTPEPAGEPETAPPAPSPIEAPVEVPEPVVAQDNPLRALTTEGSPSVRKSLTMGGAVNEPLEGPASPVRPPTQPV